MRGLLKNKRGEEILTPIIIFIVLNVMFFAILFGFVYKSSQGALVYEQAYSKQIAMLIDATDPSPSTILKVNFVEGFGIAKGAGLSREGRVNIDNVNKQVIVNLGRSKGGYATRFFSDHEIGIPYPNGGEYFIVVNKKKN